MQYQAFEAAEGILRSMYKAMVSQIVAEQSPLLKIIQPKTDKVSGQDVKFSAMLENPQGLGSRRVASQILPKGVPGKYMELTVPTGRIYGVLNFDTKMLKAAGQNKEGRNAYVNYLEMELSGIKTTLNLDLGRQLFGEKTGFISATGVTAGSLIVQLDTDANMEYYVEGMHIDIVANATGIAIANGEDREIMSVDVDDSKITLDGSGGVVTTDATHRVTREGSYNAEMTGLKAIVSDTTDIYGVVTASQRRWKAYVDDTAEAYSLKKIGKIALAAKTRSGVWADLIVSSPNKMMQVWYELTGSKTFDTAVKSRPIENLGAGYYKINVMIEGHNMEWVADPNCPDDRIYGLRKENIGIQHLGPPEFMDIKGEILLPNIYGSTGTPTVKAVLEYFPEFIVNRRNPHWLWNGVTDLAGW